MPKKVIPKTKTNKNKKYQKPLSLFGVEEVEALKDILKSPPMPKKKKKSEN